MTDEVTEYVKNRIIGTRNSLVEGMNLYYSVYSVGNEYYKILEQEEFEAPQLLYCHITKDGEIYISELKQTKEEFRERFQDIIAYHEKIEYDWLKEIGLPTQRWTIEKGTKNREISEGIHRQAIWLELCAAKNMGILDEYYNFRPFEETVETYYCKLAKGWELDTWDR